MSPILDQQSLEIFSKSASQTRRVGMRLGALLNLGDAVFLQGDLGSGKTTLVQGIVAGWGSLDTVSSPTFVLVNTYTHPDGSILYHLDAYRLSGAQEAWDLDLDTLLQTGLLVVEWADRIKPALPQEGLWIAMEWVTDEHRSMSIHAVGKRFESLLIKLKQRVYVT